MRLRRCVGSCVEIDKVFGSCRLTSDLPPKTFLVFLAQIESVRHLRKVMGI